MKKTFFYAFISFLFILSTNAQNLSPKKDKETKKHGFVNESDEWIVKPIYDKTEKFRDGYAKMKLDKKEGLIDETGKVVVEPLFDDIDKFEGDIAIVKNDRRYGFINRAGKTLLEPKYDKIQDFKGEYAIIIDNKKNGIVSIKGNVIIEPKYDEIELPFSDFTYVKNGELWGVVKSDGSEIFVPEYLEKFSFNSKGLSVAKKTGKYGHGAGASGVVNREGSVIVELNQGIVDYEPGHFFIFSKDNKWYITDDDAKPISGEFEGLKQQIKNRQANYYVDGKIIAKKDGKYGFIDINGNTLIPFSFDDIVTGGFSEGLCGVKVDSKWGYINVKGEYFIQPEFEEVGRFELKAKVPMAVVMKDELEYSLNGNTKELLVLDNLKNQAVLKKRAEPQVSPQSQSTTTSPTATSPKVDNNDWLIGTWTVTEEVMGGIAKTGNSITYVKYIFNANGTGSIVERTDILANKTTTKSTTWKLEGNKLKIDTLNYTIIPGADKKTMTMNGMLGTKWKVKK